MPIYMINVWHRQIDGLSAAWQFAMPVMYFPCKYQLWLQQKVDANPNSMQWKLQLMWLILAMLASARGVLSAWIFEDVLRQALMWSQHLLASRRFKVDLIPIELWHDGSSKATVSSDSCDSLLLIAPCFQLALTLICILHNDTLIKTASQKSDLVEHMIWHWCETYLNQSMVCHDI